MFETPANGVLLLASLCFLTIGLVGWLSFPDPDRSAKLWLAAFSVSGLAPLIGAANDVNTIAYIASAIAFIVSFVLFGLSLRVLYDDKLSLRDYSFVLGFALVLFSFVLLYLYTNSSIRGQATAFALSTGVAAAWATNQAIHLTKHNQSRFASHLVIIFGIQATMLFLRVPQVWFGEESRLSGNDPLALTIVVVLSLCGVVKAVSYFALRLEEIRNRVERNAEIVRDQAKRLAQKNTELVSAMHAAPVACVVTRPTLEVIYLNAEARRLLGDPAVEDKRPRLSDWVVGMQGAHPVSIASARHIVVRMVSRPDLLIAEISGSGIESTEPASQWVFLLKPVQYSDAHIESVWASLPRVEDRTWLITDNSGRVASAQAAWGEVLGRYAEFDSPELRFGGISESRDAAGMDLWATLRHFSGPSQQLDRAKREQLSGRATTFLLRNAEGSQLSCAITPLESSRRDDTRWLIEIHWKPAATTTRSVPAKAATSVTLPSEAPSQTPAETGIGAEIPAFLKKI